MNGPHLPDITPIQIDPNIWCCRILITHKAAGPDKIPTHLLKEANIEIAPILTFIFQASLQQSSVQSDWKIANIVPLFKKAIIASQTTTDLYH